MVKKELGYINLPAGSCPMKWRIAKLILSFNIGPMAKEIVDHICFSLPNCVVKLRIVAINVCLVVLGLPVGHFAGFVLLAAFIYKI